MPEIWYVPSINLPNEPLWPWNPRLIDSSSFAHLPLVWCDWGLQLAMLTENQPLLAVAQRESTSQAMTPTLSKHRQPSKVRLMLAPISKRHHEIVSLVPLWKESMRLLMTNLLHCSSQSRISVRQLPYCACEEAESQYKPKEYGDEAEIRSKAANEVYEA